MKSLREYITEAVAEKKAIGHFNISTIEALWSIFHAARSFAPPSPMATKGHSKASEGEAQKLGEPVIIGVSEGERKFLGVRQVVALVKSIRQEYDYPIFLNADHTYSFDGVKEAIDAGFDAVIFDGAKLSLEENITVTKECVAYARSAHPDIIVEGELGYIGTSSKVFDELPKDMLHTVLTAPEDAVRFVKETGVDLLAPSVGNLHGMLRKREADAEGNAKQTQNPPLDSKRVARIREVAGVPLVLHGGSGIADTDFLGAIQAGVAIVHINTELRVAWRGGVEAALEKDRDEVAPYELLQGAKEAVEKVVMERIRLFSNSI